MARGVKARWHSKTRPRTAEENGSVLAAVSYKGARMAIQRLLGADYEFTSDARRFAILAEILAFQVQMADRLAYAQLDEISRRRLINATGQHLARLCDLVEPEDKRWLVESIVDVEAPKVVENLLSGWRILYPRETPADSGPSAG